jgi:hypothetical protein
MLLTKARVGQLAKIRARHLHAYISHWTCSRPLPLLLSSPLLRVPPLCAKEDRSTLSCSSSRRLTSFLEGEGEEGEGGGEEEEEEEEAVVQSQNTRGRVKGIHEFIHTYIHTYILAV